MSEEQKIPTISLWNPWAPAIVVNHPFYPGTGLKQYETRSWQCPEKYIGKRVLVHAAKKDDEENTPMLLNWPFSRYNVALKGKLHYGAIIGSVVIEECITTEKFIELPVTDRTDEEMGMGDYSIGRYAWKLNSPVLFDVPVVIRGFQKIYGTPLSIIHEKYHYLFSPQFI